MILQGWTIRQVIGLAPNTNTMIAAKALQASRQWEDVGHDGYCAWATWTSYTEDDSKPHRVKIDFVEIQSERSGYACTCKKHRQPCEHALALLLLVLDNTEALRQQTVPEDVEQWLNKRSRRVRARLERRGNTIDDDTADNTDAVQQSREQRMARMSDGLDELARWLTNLMREGLGHARVNDPDYWKGIADHMVDAQIPGIAERLQKLATVPATESDLWVTSVLSELGSMYLLFDIFGRYDEMPVAIQLDVRTALGWPPKPEEVNFDERVTDTWDVVGRREIKRHRNSFVRRTWLVGRATARVALVAEHVFDKALFRHNLLPGTALTGDVAFYPSRFPLRAVVESHQVLAETTARFDGLSIALAMQQFGTAMAQNPWLSESLLILSGVIPVQIDGHWYVREGNGHALPLTTNFANQWPFVALSGGLPVPVAGEWDGSKFFPLGVLATGGRYVDLMEAASS